MDKTVSLMKDIGQAPVVAKKEVNGFILNQLQYAVIMQAWRLVEVRNLYRRQLCGTLELLGLTYVSIIIIEWHQL